MTCDEANEAFLRLLEASPGTGDEAQKAAIFAHISRCPDCQERLLSLAWLLALDPAVIPCADCQDRLHHYIDARLDGTPGEEIDPEVFAHLQACPECAELEALVRQDLISMMEDDSPLFEAKPAKAHPRPIVFPVARVPRWAWAAAAVMLIAVGLGSVGLGGYLAWLYLGEGFGQGVAIVPDPTSFPETLAPQPTDGQADAPSTSQIAEPPSDATTGPTGVEIGPPVVALLSPENGASVTDEVIFSWSTSSPLASGEEFALQVCKGERCAPEETIARTSGTDWKWCPDEEDQIYRWRVVIPTSDETGLVAASPEWGFIWAEGDCGAIVQGEATAVPEGSSPGGTAAIAPPPTFIPTETITPTVQVTQYPTETATQLPYP